MNHSARKTFISNLLDNGVPPTEVAQISSHKNHQSLNHHHSLSLDRQQQLSAVIHTPPKSGYSASATTVADKFVEDEINEILRTLKKLKALKKLEKPFMPLTCRLYRPQ